MAMNCSRCKDELNLKKLCVCKIKADCAEIHKIVVNNICAQSGEVKDFMSENATLDKLCVPGRVTASEMWSDKGNFNSLCATNANFQNACVSNLQIGNFSPCIKYRATINFGADVTYTLGSFLNFNNVLDDPNGNVSFVPSTSYTAPASGYYMFTLKTNSQNLLPSSDPVLGAPIGNPEVFVNGLLVREGYTPFLSFFNVQKFILSSLITLQAGDVITMKYNVLGGNGVPVVGTVDISGSGVEDGNSFFKIVFLSGLCSNGGTQPQCPPCPPVVVPCDSVLTPCLPLEDKLCKEDRPDMNPCESCQ